MSPWGMVLPNSRCAVAAMVARIRARRRFRILLVMPDMPDVRVAGSFATPGDCIAWLAPRWWWLNQELGFAEYDIEWCIAFRP